MTTTQDPVAIYAAGEHQVPCEALRFTCDATFTKDADGKRDANGVREYPVTVVARRGGVVDHWYWGRIVHNLAGVRTKDKVALDWCHSNELIGYADKIDSGSGNLVLSGRLISVKDDDRADEVGKKGAAGIPFESSIFWDPYTAEIHYLAENATETVNGQTVTGPCYVVDKWDLRGQAICPYGVDGQTKTQFSAGLPATIPLKVKDSAMTKDATNPAAATDAGKETTKDAAGGAATNTGAQTTGATADTSRSDARSELRRYIDKFGGEAGAQYFADGLSWEAALEKHLDAQKGDIKKAQDAKAEAERKLASIDRGASGPTTDTGAGASQGDNQARKGLESLVKFK